MHHYNLLTFYSCSPRMILVGFLRTAWKKPNTFPSHSFETFLKLRSGRWYFSHSRGYKFKNFQRVGANHGGSSFDTKHHLFWIPKSAPDTNHNTRTDNLPILKRIQTRTILYGSNSIKSKVVDTWNQFSLNYVDKQLHLKSRSICKRFISNILLNKYEES